MSAISQIVPPRADSTNAAHHDVKLKYQGSDVSVLNLPETVNKNDTIQFSSDEGTVRIVFVSPFDQDMIEVADKEIRELTVGGIFHFRCFLRPSSGGPEIKSKSGGILDVTPHRP